MFTSIFKVHFFISALCVLMFISCNSLVDDEFPDFAALPVMNGLLQADSAFRVQISLAANLSDTMPDYVDNALVIIENQGNIPDTLLYVDEGWYVSPRIVKTGETYSCSVEIPGFNTMTAHTIVPQPTEIDSVIYTDVASRGQEGEIISSIEFRIRDERQIEKFWEVKLKERRFGMYFDWDINDWVEGLHIREGYILMQAEQDSVLLNEANPLTVFSNRKMKTDQHWMKLYFNKNNFIYSTTDTLFVELQNIDESYYNYAKQYYIYETASSGGIGTSPQRYPLYSNVVNGLGLFTGVSVTWKDIEVR